MVSRFLDLTNVIYAKVDLSPYLFLFAIPLSLILIFEDYRFNFLSNYSHHWIIPFIIVSLYLVIWNFIIILIGLFRDVNKLIKQAAILSTINSIIVLFGFSFMIIYQIEYLRDSIHILSNVDGSLASLIAMFIIGFPSILILVYAKFVVPEFENSYKLINYSIPPLTRAIMVGEINLKNDSDPRKLLTEINSYELQSVGLIKFIKTTNTWNNYSFKLYAKELILSFKKIKTAKLSTSDIKDKTINIIYLSILFIVYLLIFSPFFVPLVLFSIFSTPSYAIIFVFLYLSCTFFASNGYLKLKKSNNIQKSTIWISSGIAIGLASTLVSWKNWILIILINYFIYFGIIFTKFIDDFQSIGFMIVLGYAVLIFLTSNMFLNKIITNEICPNFISMGS